VEETKVVKTVPDTIAPHQDRRFVTMLRCIIFFGGESGWVG
jgi:hypothetical protein